MKCSLVNEYSTRPRSGIRYLNVATYDVKQESLTRESRVTTMVCDDNIKGTLVLLDNVRCISNMNFDLCVTKPS